ncbi:5043_t:CDS:2 [Paraglomus brasilianum]|uniref:5043_t:CDS:1 n=1 Tax=Paraglomus brasilianum TaxID=144538 RepID=A0A9N9BKU0_9GLOM|nr:5043_t:CDS:2 [Paraglomus brasilianum]
MWGSSDLPDIAREDIRVVVGIDFGTTFSGFAYANKKNPDVIETHETWPEQKGVLKTPTVLQYDSAWTVTQWGSPALATRPNRKRMQNQHDKRPVELFKLHLGNMKENEKPPLPAGLDFKKAITDYLKELKKLMTDALITRWPGLDFNRHVLKIMTVPAEYDERARYSMRMCSYQAGLIDTVNSDLLQFTSEPEAAAIYCMRVLKEHDLKEGSTFLIVDCGGGTVDLTMRTLQSIGRLKEVTERTGDFCGGSYVDAEFLKFLSRKVGESAVELLKKNHYTQLQYMVQEFCNRVKFEFTGDPKRYATKEMDLEEVCPVLMQYVKGDYKERMEEAEWLIELNFAAVKDFFDTVVGRIIRLIRGQLAKAKAKGVKCQAMFLVGGFSESPYILKRVKEDFGREVKTIAVPSEPIAAVVRGAVYYGLQMDSIQTRVLKSTYGVEIYPEWKSTDPTTRKTNDGRIYKFYRLATRGTEVKVDQQFGYTAYPVFPTQTGMKFDIYTTSETDATFCDERGMSSFGTLEIELPDTNLGTNRPVDFTLTFGKMETRATAKNKTNGKVYEAKFKLQL